jgi:hypothetical protein
MKIGGIPERNDPITTAIAWALTIDIMWVILWEGEKDNEGLIVVNYSKNPQGLRPMSH